MRTCDNDGCNKPLGRRNVTGICKSCVTAAQNRDPVTREAIRRGYIRHLAVPENREAHLKRSCEHLRKWRSTPEGRAKHVAQARANLAIIHEQPDAVKRQWFVGSRLPGIPEHRWDEAVALGIRLRDAGEAKRIIIADEAEQERRRIAALTPHERQLERIRAGARVVERVPMPRRGAEHVVGGSSLADCG